MFSFLNSSLDEDVASLCQKQKRSKRSFLFSFLIRAFYFVCSLFRKEERETSSILGISPKFYSIKEDKEVMVERFCHRLCLHRGQRVLDIGCYSTALLKYIDENCDVYLDGLVSNVKRYKQLQALGLKRCQFHLATYTKYKSPIYYSSIYSFAVYTKPSFSLLKNVERNLLPGATFTFFFLYGKSPCSSLDKSLNLQEYLSNWKQERLVLDVLVNLSEHYDRTLMEKKGDLPLFYAGCLRTGKVNLNLVQLRKY